MASPWADGAITRRSTVVASADQVSSQVAGEAIVLSLRTGMYYGLAQVGLRVWELIRDPIGVAELCEVIAREYDVERERCERDILALLYELAAEGLLDVRGDASEPAR
jgi:hypothetical protein